MVLTGPKFEPSSAATPPEGKIVQVSWPPLTIVVGFHAHYPIFESRLDGCRRGKHIFLFFTLHREPVEMAYASWQASQAKLPQF
jgi:hypothetical protein